MKGARYVHRSCVDATGRYQALESRVLLKTSVSVVRWARVGRQRIGVRVRVHEHGRVAEAGRSRQGEATESKASFRSASRKAHARRRIRASCEDGRGRVGVRIEVEVEVGDVGQMALGHGHQSWAPVGC